MISGRFRSVMESPLRVRIECVELQTDFWHHWIICKSEANPTLVFHGRQLISRALDRRFPDNIVVNRVFPRLASPATPALPPLIDFSSRPYPTFVCNELESLSTAEPLSWLNSPIYYHRYGNSRGKCKRLFARQSAGIDTGAVAAFPVPWQTFPNVDSAV